MTSLLWLRRDLRRADLPALAAAAADGPVVVAFVLDDALWLGAGAARQAWLAATLRATDAAYEGRLVLRSGRPEEVIPALVEEVGASSVHVSRETTPAGQRRDRKVAEALSRNGVRLVETGTPYAVGPGVVTTGQGTAYKVFTPFHRAWLEHGWPAPAVEPARLALRPAGSDPDAWLRIDAAIDGSPCPLPEPGEGGVLARWEAFTDGALADYDTARDLAAVDGTSKLSPYLKLGVVHPRTLLAGLTDRRGEGAERFRAEIAWREFYADVLWHNPSSAWTDLRPALQGMAYDDDGPLVEAWREGRTGYPFVDAGMRQLRATGWMHNRVRMVTASFLTKDLHVWWPVGARHFLEHLIDGDIASNNHGWQWVSGSGTDASPYFRVFNPISQGQRFDPDGDYVRRWVPELAHLPGAAVHEPWRADDGYSGGYPQRIVDHAEERAEALRRYAAVRA